MCASRNDVLDDVAEVAFEAFVAGDFHALGLEAELMQQCRVHVGDVMGILLGVKTNLVGGAVGGWTPAAHLLYWRDRRFARHVADFLVTFVS